MQFCGNPLDTRSKYAAIAQRRCQREQGHTGPCGEFPYLRDLESSHPAVAAKIKRDSTMTTGASWSSKDAGPNRILRWVMLLSDDELLAYGIDMMKLKPQVVAKLRDKAATYDECMAVARQLTWATYQMPNAPTPSSDVRVYLEECCGPLTLGKACCSVCRLPLSFDLFAEARRGKAAIETSHMDPRKHDPANVAFAHRECNIAQGPMTLNQFYDWIQGILERAERIGGRS
jgi:hypothetical protein